MRTLQLYATGSATANAVAQVTIPSATTLRGVFASLLINSITDDAVVRVELSKVPTSQITVNGAQDPFLQLGIYGNFVTSGLAQGGVNQYFPLSVACRQGEIVYLHATVSGTVVYFGNFIFAY